MKILYLDNNHSLLINQLNELGYTNDEDYTSSKSQVEENIDNWQRDTQRYFDVEFPYFEDEKLHRIRLQELIWEEVGDFRPQCLPVPPRRDGSRPPNRRPSRWHYI